MAEYNEVGWSETEIVEVPPGFIGIERGVREGG